MSKYILFYKNLIKFGGAEKLLLNNYDYLSKKNFDVCIVTFKCDLDIGNRKVKILKNHLSLLIYLICHYKSKIIASSGHINLFLISFIINKKFNYLIHQPSTMSFNEYDKYAFNNLEKLKVITDTRYLRLFNKIKSKINPAIKIYLNIRFLFSKLALQYANNTFVLSEYAAKEKKILYNIKSNVLYAGISQINKHDVSLTKRKDQLIKIISISRLDINKRIQKAIRAIKLSNRKDIILNIYGEGPYKKDLQKIINVLNMENQIFLKGFISEDLKPSQFHLHDYCLCIDFADFRIAAIEAINNYCHVLLSSDTDNVSKYDGLFTIVDANTKKLNCFFKNLNMRNSNWDKRKLFLEEHLWDNYFDQILKII